MKKTVKILLSAIFVLAMCFTIAYASADITVSNVNTDVSDGTAAYSVTVTNMSDNAVKPAVIVVYYESDILKAIDIQKIELQSGASADVTTSVDVEVTDASKITGFVVNDMNLGIPVSVEQIEKFGSRNTGIESVSIAGLTQDRVEIDNENKTVSLYLPYYDREGNSVDFSAAGTEITLSDENARVELVDATAEFDGEGSIRTASVNYNTKKQFKVTAEEGNSDVYDVKIFKMVKEDFEDETPILEATGDEIVDDKSTVIYRGIGDKASSYLSVSSSNVTEGYGSGLTAGYGEGRDSDNSFWLSKTTHNNKTADTGNLRFYFGRVEGTSNTQTVEFDIKYEYVGEDGVQNTYRNPLVACLEVRSGSSLIYRLGGSNVNYSSTASPQFYLGNNVGKITISPSSGNILQWHRVRVEFYVDSENKCHSRLYIDGEHIAQADDIMEVTDKVPSVFSICLSTRRCMKMYIDNIEFTHSVDGLEAEASLADAGEHSAELMASDDLSFTPSISPEGEITVTGYGNAGKVSAAVTTVESPESELNLDALGEDDFIAYDAMDTNPDGSFSFKWKLPDVDANGYYAFVVGNTDVITSSDARTVIMYYASPAEVERALSKLNSANAQTMESALEDAGLVLQLGTLLESEIYKKYTDDVVETFVADMTGDFETATEVSEALSIAIGVSTVANSDEASIADAIKIYGEILKLDMIAYEDNADAVARCFEAVSKEYRDSNTPTTKNISELFNTAIALAKVNTSARGDIIDVIADNEAYLGIDTSDLSTSEKNSVAKKIVVTDEDDEYMTVLALEKAYDKAVDSLDDGNGGGGGGGSSRPSYTPQADSATVIATGDTQIEIQISDDIAVNVPVFADLHLAPWAEGYIICLAENGIVNGKSEGIFDPNAPVTREEFAKMLTIAVKASGSADVSFTDVSMNAWYAPYIAAAVDAGIVTGYDDGTFGVGKNISREEAAVMIFRAARLIHAELPHGSYSFADSDDISSYAEEAIASCVALGIIDGNNKNEFLPQNDITRAECAKMIYCLIRTE